MTFAQVDKSRHKHLNDLGLELLSNAPGGYVVATDSRSNQVVLGNVGGQVYSRLKATLGSTCDLNRDFEADHITVTCHRPLILRAPDHPLSQHLAERWPQYAQYLTVDRNHIYVLCGTTVLPQDYLDYCTSSEHVVRTFCNEKDQIVGYHILRNSENLKPVWATPEGLQHLRQQYLVAEFRERQKEALMNYVGTTGVVSIQHNRSTIHVNLDHHQSLEDVENDIRRWMRADRSGLFLQEPRFAQQGRRKVLSVSMPAAVHPSLYELDGLTIPALHSDSGLLPTNDPNILVGRFAGHDHLRVAAANQQWVLSPISLRSNVYDNRFLLVRRNQPDLPAPLIPANDAEVLAAARRCKNLNDADDYRSSKFVEFNAWTGFSEDGDRPFGSNDLTNAPNGYYTPREACPKGPHLDLGYGLYASFKGLGHQHILDFLDPRCSQGATGGIQYREVGSFHIWIAVATDLPNFFKANQ